MEDLFSDDARLREKIAGQYKEFAGKTRIPSKFRSDWRQLLGDRDIDAGLEWPEELAKLAHISQWPEYAFGTANAACLLVMHRPGLDDGVEKVEDLERTLFIEPRFPVLGGIPHAHITLFWERYLRREKPKGNTWRNIYKYLKPAFGDLNNPWSQLMTCNLNPRHGHYGEVDDDANIQGLRILNHVVALCQPKLILLCGGYVHKATSSWNTSLETHIVKVAHPSAWDRHNMNLPGGCETAGIIQQTLFDS